MAAKEVSHTIVANISARRPKKVAALAMFLWSSYKSAIGYAHVHLPILIGLSNKI